MRAAELQSAFQATFVRWLTATKTKLRRAANKGAAARHLIEPAEADKQLRTVLTDQVAALLGARCAVLQVAVVFCWLRAHACMGYMVEPGLA